MSEPNPFEPPSEHADEDAPRATSRPRLHSLKLYSPNQVALGAFLGSPIASGWLMSSNYTALDRPSHARKALVWGTVATATLVVAALLLPESGLTSLVAIGYTFGARETARHFQGKIFANVQAAGGARHSSWRVLGIGVVSLFLFFLVFFLIGLVAGVAGWEFGGEPE